MVLQFLFLNLMDDAFLPMLRIFCNGSAILIFEPGRFRNVNMLVFVTVFIGICSSMLRLIKSLPHMDSLLLVFWNLMDAYLTDF